MGEFAKAVERGIDNTFINWANDFGDQIARRVSTSQIRNIFGSVKKMEMAGEVDLPGLLLLKPRIAYAVQRNKALGDLAKELEAAIDAVDAVKGEKQQHERFRRFCQGFEAILAYHRAHGGK
jgi:CRISPR-associated protein Csm2